MKKKMKNCVVCKKRFPHFLLYVINALVGSNEWLPEKVVDIDSLLS
jgi:hypothetical protein